MNAHATPYAIPFRAFTIRTTDLKIDIAGVELFCWRVTDRAGGKKRRPREFEIKCQAMNPSIGVDREAMINHRGEGSESRAQTAASI